MVVYRGTAEDGTEAELRLLTAAEGATMVDAWTRLSARFGPVDPRSIEIEIRERAGREKRWAPPEAARGAVSRLHATHRISVLVPSG